MSEVVVYKSNELAVSRYNLTEQETKLLLYCVGLIDPRLENPTREQRTCTIKASDYSEFFNLDINLTYKNLKNATNNLTDRKIEILYSTGDIEKHIFHWINSAKYNRNLKEVELVFSEDIQPYLYTLNKFIKYNLEHVKAFENKYSVRVYEWLLKELTQRKTNKTKVEIKLDEFKYMLMLENNYSDNRNLKSKLLNKIIKDINTYSNMELKIDTKGRPVDTLIFNCELDNQIDLITELAKQDREIKPINTPKTQNKGDLRLENLKEIQSLALNNKISLSAQYSEKEFIDKMINHFYKTRSFVDLTEKQVNRIAMLIKKYLGK